MSEDPEQPLKVRGCDGCAVDGAAWEIVNRPGLSALDYRIGTWNTFRARMLAGLSTQTNPPQPGDPTPPTQPLSHLNHGADEDPAIALLDAFAVVADVLTFYQERIANEGFLRTAVERRSVLELARAIGYELAPGVAASTYLAFTIDDLPSSPKTTLVPVGTQVQSVPGPGQTPQTFETVEAISARGAWNQLLPRRTQPQAFHVDGGKLNWWNLPHTKLYQAQSLYLAGTATRLQPGDWLLAVVGKERAPVKVQRVVVDDDAKLTTVHLGNGAAVPPPLPRPAYPPKETTGVVEQAPLPLEPKVVAERVVAKVWDEGSLAAFCAVQKWDPDVLVVVVNRVLADRAASSELHAFRQEMGCFGHNAPRYAQVRLQPTPSADAIETVLGFFEGNIEGQREIIAKDVAYELTRKPNPDSGDWDLHKREIAQDDAGGPWRTADRPYDVFLERPVAGLTLGSYVLFEQADHLKSLAIERAGEQTLSEFGITGRATGLSLVDASALKNSGFMSRSTAVHVQSEELALAALPVLDVIEDRGSDPLAKPQGANAIELDCMVLGLRVGQALLVHGVTVGEDDLPGDLLRSEAVRISAIVHEAGFTTLYFEKGLRYRYVRTSVGIAANVAEATHGQTVAREILGSGNAGARSQSFTLQKPPLTWISAPTASGRASTLTVRVDDQAWTEVPGLYGLLPDSRSYMLRASDDGRTSIVFGNGVTGAPLSTGTGNVTASYRSGLGLAGQVPAFSLTTLMSRPLGVKDVSNPLAADGAAEPESRDRARKNAPVSVLTLDRIVSLLDYQSFTRTFAGVGKSQAVALWDGRSELVHISVASADGTPLGPESLLAQRLVAAIEAASDGRQRVQVDGYVPRYFGLEAKLTVEPLADPTLVLEGVRAALLKHFAFEHRSFGQRVTSAEVMTVIQSVRHVIASNILTLAPLDGLGAPLGSGVSAILNAEVARWSDSGVKLAELLLLSSRTLKLSIEGVLR